MPVTRKYLIPLLIVVCAGFAWWMWPRPAAGATRTPLPLMQGTSREELDEAERLARFLAEVPAPDEAQTL